MKMFTISEDVLNKVLAVLIELPYKVSAEAIQSIQQGIEPVVIPEADTEDTPSEGT